MSICDVPLYTQIADDAAQKIVAVLCGNIYTQIIAFSLQIVNVLLYQDSRENFVRFMQISRLNE